MLGLAHYTAAGTDLNSIQFKLLPCAWAAPRALYTPNALGPLPPGFAAGGSGGIAAAAALLTQGMPAALGTPLSQFLAAAEEAAAGAEGQQELAAQAAELRCVGGVCRQGLWCLCKQPIRRSALSCGAASRRTGRRSAEQPAMRRCQHGHPRCSAILMHFPCGLYTAHLWQHVALLALTCIPPHHPPTYLHTSCPIPYPHPLPSHPPGRCWSHYYEYEVEFGAWQEVYTETMGQLEEGSAEAAALVRRTLPLLMVGRPC